MKIVADQDIPFIENYFGAYGSLVLKPGRAISREDLQDADLLLVRSVTLVGEELLKGTPVKFVGTVTTGLDHLDTAWLDQAGIQWSSAAGYNAQAVSEYVVAVLAALEGYHSPRSAGIIGVGQVGSRVAERMQGLGLRTLLCDPPRAEEEADFQSQSLSALQKADLISLHTPLTKSGGHPTYHLLETSFLAVDSPMKILINTSRGSVVDFSALKEQQGQWLCCFDVWEGEPVIDLAWLQSVFIATPHLAGYSVQARYRGIDLIYRAACEAEVLEPKEQAFPVLPGQTLAFGGKRMSWQEVVLAVFNPLEVTQVMKEVLLKEPEKCATLFDQLRQQYIGDSIKRHEFAYTRLMELRLAESDRSVLTHLGFIIKE